MWTPSSGIAVPNLQVSTRAGQLHYHPYVSGSTRLKLPQAPMVTIPMVLAPEPEQRRIVEAIEEQFTRLDAAVAGLKRVQRELKRYRASVLKAACEGRLVPTEAELARAEGRELEPADRLLTRILEKRLVRGGAKYKEPTPPDLTSLPAPPDGWFWTTMDVVTVLLRNGYGKMPDANTGTRILRISAVRPRALNINDVRFLSGSTEDYTQYLVKPGDVLFTRYNGNADLVGVCATVRSVPEPTVHPDKLIRCELLSEFCLPQFIEIAANVGASRDHMARRVRTTAGQSGISGPDIRTMPIPLPPLAEQERIVAEVERRLSVVEKAEAAVEANMKRAERMRQAILRRAFEGKLVPQDPTDEPASVLLERIRAERAVSAVNGRGKRGKKGSGQLELPGLPSPPAPLSRARERGSLTRP